MTKLNKSRTGRRGAHFARRRSERLLESSMAAPPTRNRQLGISMERSFPKYQFCVMFSVETTSAVLLGYTWPARSQRISRLHAITVAYHQSPVL